MRILAAGSLRQPFTLWQQALIQQYQLQVEIEFGPAGLLCQRIEQGEKVDLFASANDAHPRSLQTRYPHIQLVPFATNRLCLIAKKSVITHHDENWLTLLMSPHLRLGVSTPKADPCGDYTLALFSNIEKRHMGYGSELKEKAMAIVGGPDSITIPTGRNTAEWLFEQNYADLFIGYASNHQSLRQHSDICVLDIPDEYNVRANYTLAAFTAEALRLVDSLLCLTCGQKYLRDCGFLPANHS